MIEYNEFAVINDMSNHCVNPVPISSAILRFLKGVQNSVQIENIKDTLRRHESDLDIIKETLLDKNFFLKTPVYEEDLLSVLQKVKDETNEEKRKLFANYLTACRHFDNIDCNSKAIYLRIVEQIDDLGVSILDVLSNYRTENHIIECIHNTFCQKISPDDIRVHLWSLESIGLIEKKGAEELEKISKRGGNIKSRHPENILFYKRTGLGAGFHNFIIKGIPRITII